MIYVDTSVLAAYYCPEPLSERAQRALAGESKRAVSPLVDVELASALARKVRAREIRRAEAHRVLTLYQSHLEQGVFTRLPIETAHFAQAREWLASLNVALRSLDALHAAVAGLQGCPLLTADAAMARACAGLGVTARLVV